MSILYLNYPEQDYFAEKLKLTFSQRMLTQVDLSVDPTQIEQQIDENIDGKKLIMGSGIGGFWANYAAQKHKIPCVLINPDINPSDYLSRQVGKTVDSITAHQVVGYITREHWLNKSQNTALVSLVLSKQDFAKTMDYFTSALLGYISLSTDVVDYSLASKVAELVEYLTKK